MISFKEAVKLGIIKTYTIKGRATRAEFWWYNLFIALLVSVLLCLGWGLTEMCRHLFSHEIFKIVDMITAIPMMILLILVAISLLTLTVRRYHDVGVSGTILLKLLIPIWWFYDGGPKLFDKGMLCDNKYGPNHYETDIDKLPEKFESQLRITIKDEYFSETTPIADTQLNSSQSLWILAIPAKIKAGIIHLSQKTKKHLTYIGVWRMLIIVTVLAIVIWGSINWCDYYKHTYIPEKRLNEVVADIENKLSSENDSIKIHYAFAILKNGKEWGYDDVADYDISNRLSKYHSEAFKYIESKAFEGDARSQYLLGQIYHGGGDKYYYATQNFDKAAYWWNEAAKQGYTKAYNNIGIAHKKGLGVQKDIEKAVYYLRMGAELGDDMAQLNYGDLFVSGVDIKVGQHRETFTTTSDGPYRGQKIREYFDNATMEWMIVYEQYVPDFKILVHKDIEQAKYWWKKSATQGNETAKDRLQKIY